jgi:hypothetical protein
MSAATLSYASDWLAITVAFDRYVWGDRAAWRYSIAEVGGRDPLCSGTDLETPTYDLVGALQSLHGFLDAWAESREHEDRTGHAGENGRLFPRDLWRLLDWRMWLDASHADLHWDDDR